MIRDECLHGAEPKRPGLFRDGGLIVLVPFKSKPKLQRMYSSGQEGVVVNLISIPAVKTR